MVKAPEGPKAPKDPTKKRPGFYIMQGKQIIGSPVDKKGVQFIYESDGRLLDAAKLIGGIEDQEIINLLRTVDGFKRLVHSIGVTVESDRSSEEVNFVFQMYGKTDPYVSGTSIEMPVKMDGMEYIFTLSDAAWSDDDNVPGQIRYEFSEPGIMASASVKFYLNDGFDAPETEELTPVKFGSDEYNAIITKSLMQTGNNYRLKKAIDKAKSGEQVTMAFIGGSITQGAGAIPINTECYAYKTFKGFCEYTGRGLDDNVKYIKAGVGGTPSELGMLRYDRDILGECTEGPDVVVIEFAVNDEGDETKGECYDSLARKIYNGPGKPAVILLFAVFSNDWNLQDRLKCVGESYKLPMVSTLNSVVDQFKLKADSGRVITKSQFFYDMYHPTNSGHTIMADGILNLIKAVDLAPADEEFDISAVVPPKGGEFEKVTVIDRLDNNCGAVIAGGGFEATDTDIQRVERNTDLFGTPQFPNNWMHDRNSSKDEPFTMDVECTAILGIFKDSASVDTGCADIFVDGEFVLKYDPHDVGWTHCNPVILLRGAEHKKHHVEIRMDDNSKNKDFTILGFGVVL